MSPHFTLSIVVLHPVRTKIWNMYVFPMQEFQGSPETALTSPLQKSVSIIYEAFISVVIRQ